MDHRLPVSRDTHATDPRERSMTDGSSRPRGLRLLLAIGRLVVATVVAHLSASAADITLPAGTLSGTQVFGPASQASTVAGQATSVATGADITVQAGRLVLNPGFSVTSGGIFRLRAVPFIQGTPTASPSPVTGTTATLTAVYQYPVSTTGLTATWTHDSGPGSATFSGGSTVQSPAGTATFTRTVTFTRAGSHVLRLRVQGADGLANETTLSVTVAATPTAIAVQPSHAVVAPSGTRSFTASVTDQFGQPMTASPTWSASGGGSFPTSTVGSFAAGSTTGGPHTITVTANGLSAKASVMINVLPPSTVIYPIAEETVYRTSNGSGAITTRYDYVWWEGTQQTAVRTTTLPSVPTDQNGSGAATSVNEVYDALGRVIWSRDAAGFITYQSYDLATGAVTSSIVDVDTTKIADFANLPTGWSRSGGLHLKTTASVDTLGRRISVTDPKGNVTCTVYKDAAFEVRTYRGWDSVAGTVVGPTEVLREDRARNYRERLTMTVTPAAATPTGGVNRPTGAEGIANVQTLERTFLDANYRPEFSLTYTSFADLTYSPESNLGTLGTHYLRSQVGYDARGRLVRQVAPDGTITLTDVDGLGRPFRIRKGKTDAGAVRLKEMTYDGGGVGLGTVTSTTTYGDQAGAEVAYVSTATYDFRGRLVTSKGPDNVLTSLTLDHLGRTTISETYANGTVLAANLRGKAKIDYDELGRTWCETVWQVDPVNGTPANQAQVMHWYDARGLRVKTANANGLFTKSGYDGAGRVVMTCTSVDANETVAHAEALTRAGDTVASATITTYDAASNPIVVTSVERLDGDTATGDLAPTSTRYHTTAVSWYDKAGRPIAVANYGRDNVGTALIYSSAGAFLSLTGGLPTVAVNAPPAANSSDGYQIVRYGYDAAGRRWETTDNLGRIHRTITDPAGRVTKQIANVVGTPAVTDVDRNQTSERFYLATGQLDRVVASVPNGTAVVTQTTQYLYNDPRDAGLATDVIHPDSSTASATDRVITTYDRLARVLTVTDQRQVVRTRSYDSAGRALADTATSLPTGVDAAVRRIQTAYDDLSRVRSVTSTSDVAGLTPVDQVVYTYNQFGLVANEAQELGGAVVAASPKVVYAYADGASNGFAAHLRLASITYPNGTAVHHGYASAAGLDRAANRIQWLAPNSAGTSRYAEFTYAGSGRLAKQAYPTAGGLAVDLGTGTARFNATDRFARPTSLRWMVGTAVRDGQAHTYDRANNRLSRDLLWDAAPITFDEFVTYDQLDRLSAFRRGTLASNAIAATAATSTQGWTLDVVGNWRQFTQDADGAGAGTALSQTRAHNRVNEIDTDDTDSNTPGNSLAGTGVDWVDPIYDKAGSMTRTPMPGAGGTAHDYVYDAWNRLVQVKAGATAVASMRYDGLGRRVQYVAHGAVTWTTRFIYDSRGQEIEVRAVSSTAVTRTHTIVHSPGAIDKPLWTGLVSTDAGSPSYVYTRDALGSVTALVSASGTTAGQVVERYRYDPYGTWTILQANGTSVIPTSAVFNRIGYTGRRIDAETGLWNYRARYLHPMLGRFISRDPAGFVDGMNLYAYARSSPYLFFDPTGLSADISGWDSLSDLRVDWHSHHLDVDQGMQDALANFLRGLFVEMPKGLFDAWRGGRMPFEKSLNGLAERALDPSKVVDDVTDYVGRINDAYQTGDGRALGGHAGDILITATTTAVGLKTPVVGGKPLPVASRTAPRIPGKSSGLPAGYQALENRAAAYLFYKQQGWEPDRIMRHLRGIDFSKPVVSTVIPKGTQVSQWQRPGSTIGDYFAQPGTPPTNLGIKGAGKDETTYTVPADRRALQSTAAPALDYWSGGAPEQTLGGATQLFSPNLHR